MTSSGENCNQSMVLFLEVTFLDVTSVVSSPHQRITLGVLAASRIDFLLYFYAPEFQA